MQRIVRSSKPTVIRDRVLSLSARKATYSFAAASSLSLRVRSAALIVFKILHRQLTCGHFHGANVKCTPLAEEDRSLSILR